MALTLVTGPQMDPISLADIKAHLRIDGALEDPTLNSYLQAARLHLEGKDGWLGRAFITQTWDWTLDRFPYAWWPHRSDCPAAMTVPLPPLQSVTSITYIDGDGATQTVNPADYSIDSKSEPGRIMPAYGKTWPATRAVPNAVTVRFVAGYGPGPDSIPRAIRLALVGLCGDYYTNRDTGGARPEWVESLLAPYRSWV